MKDEVNKQETRNGGSKLDIKNDQLERMEVMREVFFLKSKFQHFERQTEKLKTSLQ